MAVKTTKTKASNVLFMRNPRAGWTAGRRHSIRQVGSAARLVAGAREQLGEHAADPLIAGLAVKPLVPVLRHVDARQPHRRREHGEPEGVTELGRDSGGQRRDDVGAARGVRGGHERRHAADDLFGRNRALERPLDELVRVPRAGRRHEHVPLRAECRSDGFAARRGWSRRTTLT